MTDYRTKRYKRFHGSAFGARDNDAGRDDYPAAYFIRKESYPRDLPLLGRSSGTRVAASAVCAQTTRRLALNSGLLLSFASLHVADGVVTYLGLRFARVDEVNPVLNYFAELCGLGASIAVLKALILALIAFIFIDRHTIKSCWGTATLALAVMFYCGVVTSNVLLVVGG